MKAVVLHHPGGPEMLQIEHLPIPKPRVGEVLIRVKAFGLNRSELFTRKGYSPGVRFPRVLGIEAAGIVVSAPGGEFQGGTMVLTAMGGMGRAFNGSYAEYTLVPAVQVQAITAEPSPSWEVLGAMPEMLQTAWGSLFKSLQLQPADRLLIRGGTTSIGLAAAAIAKSHGAFVTATSRRSDREKLLRDNGADETIIDDGILSTKIRKPFDKVLELIGTKTLQDSLHCAREGGLVCMTGIVGDKWTLEEINPMEYIPSAVGLTIYSGGYGDFMRTPLNAMAKKIMESELHVQIGKVFRIDEIVEAHRTMEENNAGGKIVILT
ncbi:hypothetical protein Asppvi_005398 [Aspergillus pseudoviridinutans]|uniref:Enoyl reductase (ER) domain-containing protein n=1 Tax=Aspergillus pseudoviridinutans TaxID=1517512 RepID=A0A9P3BAS4_9EURO|nr:uncharacterized protein Asppvi_005398 [Aspergillus pseudoviridinutans]GIJ86509.1 hypothetical protein Asppvi_005398 [Aspergillus pseudoviridinutans]